ncbi:hypothetical protein GM418_03505 [Maribellus comscasis]|uniref:Uncharacterized protein n=1 Tax=Maribellus comscasis TaxID=2681766 RepID=A0A6I6JKB6_9BACT|nr:hypothetical protein [Maribellus comscasis]QGY42751.1 hypothetical protein GM418_03505 [Maribellus comscasis]
MKLYLLLINLILCSFLLNAQNIQTDNNNENPKNKGLVIIGLTNNREVEKQFEEKISPSGDYLNIKISDNVLEPLDENVLGDVESELFSEKDLNLLLNNNKLGQQILSFWFARQADGTFDIKSIQEKQYLDIHEVVSLLQQTDKKRVRAEDISGFDVVNKSYIILVDFKDIQTMEEYYGQNDIEDEYRILEGFISGFNYYLVKLDFNNLVASHFFNNYLITEETEQSLSKKQEFVTVDFPFVLIKAKSDQVASTLHTTPGSESSGLDPELSKRLLGQLVNLAVDKALLNIEREEHFYKYNRIQSTKPVAASMGVNEELKFDSRYSVFTNQINESGKVEKEKIGVVKSVKVVDNRPGRGGVGDLSEFYQIGGKKTTSSGMYLERKKDLGINIGFDRSFYGPVNTSGRIEYYFSKLFDGTIQPGKRAQGLSSFKIYLEAGFNDGTYEIEELNRNFEFLRGSIGLSKDFYPVRFMHWSPFVGYGFESATYSESDNIISTNYVETGLRLGINITHNVQLIATFKNDFLINTVLLDGEREVISENFNYVRTFPNRKGVSLGLGFRIML